MFHKKNITFLITSLNGGGAERQLQSLSCSLKDRGWTVSVIAMIYPDNLVIAEALEKAGIPIYYLGMKRGRAQISAIFKLASLIRKIKPNIVHSHMVHANILARITRIFCRMPHLICTAHNTVEGGIYLNSLYKITDFMANYTTHVSRFAADKYVNDGIVSAKRIRYIPNGISTKIFSFSKQARRRLCLELSIEENSFVWITVARMEPQKDFFTLISSFKEYCSDNSILLIAGDGELRTRIEAKVKEYKLEDSIKFLGFRKDVPELLSASDAFVISSFYEGFSLVAVEAMSVGLPVVSSNNGVQTEFITNGENGFLVTPQSIEELGNAMLKIEKMLPAERNMLSEKARLNAMNYDIEKIVDIWESAYDAL